jgi:superfamily II DNA/RNA helicase
VQKMFENVDPDGPPASTFDSAPEDTAPKANVDFASLNVNPHLLSILAQKGFQTPTPIQALVIPPALEGKDIVALSHTGSGKTAAFAIPIVQKLMDTSGGHKYETSKRLAIEALVLVPTRELAVQIRQVFEMLRMHAAVAVGGQSASTQLRDIDSSRVIVATPGRLLDFIQNSFIDLRHLRYLVIDEVDRMLEMGFLNSVEAICTALPTHRQTLFFSATMPDNAATLAKKFLMEPLEVGGHHMEISRASSCAIQHMVLRLRPDQKFDHLTDVLRFIIDKQKGLFSLSPFLTLSQTQYLKCVFHYF